DGKPNRYTYSIGYSFTLPDGRTIHGYTQKIGDPVFLKPTGTDVRSIRYIKNAPYINALESDTKPNLGHLTLIITGAFLIVIINKR
ncbi:MAG: hypothetical protein Q8N36_01295, partial [bacterium]|nr:hypothetical protein [bacterium]